MNDKEEITKILPKSEVWKNVFSLCMSCSDGENMALWGLYSIPYEKGVRISFSKNVMNKILKWNRKFVEICGANNKKIFPQEINLLDVLYVSKNKADLEYPYIYRRRNDNFISYDNFKSNSEIELSQLIGCIKNDAWRYENEVRLRVNFINKINCDKIKISLPEIDYSEINIMFSPFVSNEDRLKYINIINSINDEYKKIVYEESIFSGLVNLKT
ncbi:DUF2971 domain-containing protein [Mycoplasmatota bacterium]|nr:DUF2971 domain-containing protein [Mycoplasmatota bacterium]